MRPPGAVSPEALALYSTLVRDGGRASRMAAFRTWLHAARIDQAAVVIAGTVCPTARAPARGGPVAQLVRAGDS